MFAVGYGDDISGADDIAEPGIYCGEQIAESIRLHQNASREEAMARRSGCWIRYAFLRHKPFFHLSASTLWRDAPASDDCDGAVCRPAVLIADEPTTALDVTIRRRSCN